jgi:phosphatidylglycerophosphatase A
MMYTKHNLSLHGVICTLGGLGFQPTAPGTWGSAAALIAGALIVSLFGSVGLMLLTFAVFALGVWAADHYEAETGKHDNSDIIIDEVAGQWIALVPVAYFGGGFFAYMAAFALFRAFDISKPGPIGKLDQQLKGGFGTMVDDLAAGICAAIILWITLGW